MGNNAIYVDWKYAKDHEAQIRILAEINHCSEKEIRNIIMQLRKEGDPQLLLFDYKDPRGKAPLPKEVINQIRMEFMDGVETKRIAENYGVSLTSVNKYVRDLRGGKKVRFAEEMKEEERKQTLEELTSLVQKTPKEPKLGEIAETLLEAIDFTAYSGVSFTVQKVNGAISVTVRSGTKIATLSQEIEEETA